MSEFFSWLERHRSTIPFIALGVVLIGIADYFAGNDISLAVFYAFPIAIVAWYWGSFPAHLLSLFSIVVWLGGDLAVGQGWVHSGLIVAGWNAVIRLAFYYVIVVLLVHIHALNTSLENRAQERALALNREIAERQRLERELLEIGERERRRVGYDLHDGLCQHLTGTALAIQVLKEKLVALGLPEAIEAGRAVKLVQEGIALSHDMAKSLQPVTIQAEGLMQALQEFAMTTGNLFNVSCRFECESPVLVRDVSAADHLYRIAQEAVGNAIKHGRATNVTISLVSTDEGTLLRVEDNGIGIVKTPQKKDGLGLRIMGQRAKLIGALFDIKSPTHGGTMIACCLPHPAVP